MKNLLASLLLMLSSLGFSQVEIPDSVNNCKLVQKGNYSYCVDPATYKANWVAGRMYKSDVEAQKYLPPDVEFFSELIEAKSFVWAKLEKQVMMWTLEFDSLYVVTGKEIIPGDSVTEPATIMYKAILKGCQGDAIGFIIDPFKDKKAIREYAVPIDQIEELTGIDLFSKLNVELQAYFESNFNTEYWPFSFE